MFKAFDVFRITDGQPVWIESASALEDAHAQIRQLAAGQPGEYLIFSHHSGEKIPVSLGLSSGGMQ